MPRTLGHSHFERARKEILHYVFAVTPQINSLEAYNIGCVGWGFVVPRETTMRRTVFDFLYRVASLILQN